MTGYADTLNNKGAVLAALGDSEGAIEAYDAALRIRPDYAQALYNKGIILLLQDRVDEAIEHLCRAWRTREHLLEKEPR